MARIDRAELVIAAAPERVYAALTDRAAIEAWLPPPGMNCTVMEFDLRPGGNFRTIMKYLDSSGSPGKSTSASDIVVSTFIEVVPGERIVQSVLFHAAGRAFAVPMRMAWAVHPTTGGSRVEFRADDVPTAISAEDHQLGMTASLQQLAAYLA